MPFFALFLLFLFRHFFLNINLKSIISGIYLRSYGVQLFVCWLWRSSTAHMRLTILYPSWDFFSLISFQLILCLKSLQKTFYLVWFSQLFSIVFDVLHYYGGRGGVTCFKVFHDLFRVSFRLFLTSNCTRQLLVWPFLTKKIFLRVCGSTRWQTTLPEKVPFTLF